MGARMNLFGNAQIVVGDMTSHGGIVVSGSPTNSWHGRPIVRKGDTVTCPKCSPHIFKVAEGLEHCTDTDGELPMAAEGHRTTCGAVLIARAAPASLVSAHAAYVNGLRFDEQFILHDVDGNPIPEMPYKITTVDGVTIRGVTDKDGRTDRVMSGEVQVLTIEPDTEWLFRKNNKEA
ncbi:PAAR domain-containing protein [Burkholderia cepacia]|uniref:PAAR domain-containing protein n=1 Tax=Burkholderia cepacia TaxID=292 RepID=UPI001295435E|nr:PAAR domain-containing protein [Burkholderia cepacia]